MSRLALRCLSIAAPLAAAVALSATPRVAEACGGTFCDVGPQVMPVDQTGENILFVVDGGFVEAHIQIQYEGDPERFAWVVPVTAIPEVAPGSDQLFQNLLASTVPTFTLNRRNQGDCGVTDSPGCAVSDDRASAGGDDGLDGFTSGGETGDGDGDNDIVVSQGVAGAFEYAILKGETVAEVIEWLDENNYQQDDDAPPILAEYLEEGFLFVAVKLRSGAGVEQIHPLVLTYAGDEPCVPIRLTRIAAEEDMGVRVFFMGDARMVPTNYRHVELNWLRLDWSGGSLGSNYQELVTLAVDDEAAGGHGFVTEYAGEMPDNLASGVYSSAWDPSRFASLEATGVVTELSNQGLMSCFEDFDGVQTCTLGHPLLGGLLQDFLPVPPGVDPAEFYSCLACYEELIDQEAWSGPGFATSFAEQIHDPALHAWNLTFEHDYLTRMYTTISPHEMTEDPLFHRNPDLADVSNQASATRVTSCEGGPDWFEFPDGRIVALESDGTLPDFVDEHMPAAMRIEQVPMAGAPQVETDHADEIDRRLDEWNETRRFVEGCDCRTGGVPVQGLVFVGTLFALSLPLRRRRRREA